MKRIFTLFILLLCNISYSQTEDAWVYLKDKPDAETFLDNPLSMLSQRALDRRRVQGIPLDEIDVPIYQPYIDQIAAVPGITIMAKSKWMNVLHVQGTRQEIEGLKTLSYVLDIDFANKENEENPPIIAALNSVSESSKEFRKNGSIQADLPNKQSDAQIEMLKGHLLHQQNYTGNGKIIAVFDKGFVGVDTGAPFERIRSNNQIKGGYNFIARNDDFYSGNDHGTKVLSVMAGYVENKLVGTAPDASYYLFVTKDIITVNPLLEETLWVEAAEMADRFGVDVINSSLIYSNYNYGLLDGDHAFVSRGANIAFTRGMIIVGSAGDDGDDPWRYISAPADSRYVLTVGSVDASKVRVNTSSQGPSADGRIKPDVMAMGSGVVVATEDGELDFEDGTSFSAPILTGLVACLWEALPNRSNDNIIHHIKRSADRYNYPDNLYGYGVPDFQLALDPTLATGVYSQKRDAWVYFKDKPDAEMFLNNPLSMLSQRALDRRMVQSIPLDEIDVPIHQPYIDEIAAVPGISIMAKSKWMNVLLVRGTIQEIEGLKTLSYVSDIDFANKENEENPPIASLKSVSEFSKESRKNGNIQAHLPNNQSDIQIEMLNGHLLHQQNFTGNGKIIAVFDMGFVGVDTGAPFERIRSNNQIKGGYNFSTRSDDFYNGNDHGTKVLSVMAGFVENQLVGTAPDASYYLFVLKDAIIEEPLLEETLWVEAAEMADHLGVDMINSSLGYKNYSYELRDGDHAFVSRGANIAFSRGMIIVGSAGDDGAGPSRYISAPADSPNVLAVGSVDASKVRVAISSRGPSADGRIKPDVMAMGSEVVVATEDGELDFENGTSFSAPILTGLVACLWQALPDRSNDDIIQQVKESADRYSNPNNFYGYGIPDLQLALARLATEAFTLNGFTLYPNPTEENLTIAAPGQHNAVFVLYNNLRQEVIREKLNDLRETTVSMENLRSGIYLYTIISGDATFSGKILKK